MRKSEWPKIIKEKPSRLVLDLTGKRFGRWFVEGFSYNIRYSKRGSAIYWKCRCDCGETKDVLSNSLTLGKSISCGCYALEIKGSYRRTHGMTNSSEYRTYAEAKARCTRESIWSYKYYGGRGIKFKFKSFEEFFAHLGERPRGYLLDRVDPNGHYEIGNVRWVDRKTQANNTRRSVKFVIDGKTMTLGSDRKNYATIMRRKKSGWCDSCSLNNKRYQICSHRK